MRYNSNTVNIFASFATFALLFAPVTLFAYQAAPLANTKAPTYVTEKSARINGTVNPNEMPDTYVWFEWGIAGRDQFYQTPHRNFSGGNQPYDTYEDIYGLAPNVQYFYRQVAENGRGKDIGINTYFTAKPVTITVDPLVIVNTNNANAITDSAAMLHGYIAPHESQGVQYWFQWGKTNKLENETPHTGWGGDSGMTQATLSGLTSGTVYYFRMVGQNGLGLVYGDTGVFATTGLPPPPPEAPRDQSVSGAQASDGVTRTVTTSGGTAAASGATAQSGIFGIKTQYGAPSLVFNPSGGSIFGGNKTTGTASAGNSAVNGNTNVAALGATNPVGSFWNTLTGKKVVAVQLEKIGPSKVPEHTPIEYRITYAYQVTSPATNAKLRIILPTSVVYIGDNTNNELLLEDSAGPERTYNLPIGRLENGSTRTISILGITTSDAKGAFPDARARLEYTDSVGASNVVASVSGAAESSGASSSGSSSGWSLVPTSFLGWLIYVLVITGLIFGIRKGKAYYQKRSQEIALEEEAARRDNEIPQSFSGENIPAT